MSAASVRRPAGEGRGRIPSRATAIPPAIGLPALPTPPLPATGAEPTANGHRTSRTAVRVLLNLGAGYHEPSRKERDALLVGFALCRRVLPPAAFDVVRLHRPLNLLDPHAIAADLSAIDVCEIKSTNQAAIRPDLKGYFFNITGAELTAAQSLGAQYHLVFVHTLTGHVQELTLADAFGRAKAIYPAYHIRF